jgi:aminoglycoside phosphotransferase family enzyme
MDTGATITRADADALRERVACLARPETYPHAPPQVTPIETHMSWVFLAPPLVYKLKKPVRYPFLDYRALDARRRFCGEELAINQRLGGDTYRRVLPLTRGPDGQLALDGEGEPIDWLVEMRLLPKADLLDHRLASGRITPGEIDGVGAALVAFYQRATPEISGGSVYPAHLFEEVGICRAQFQSTPLGLDPALSLPLTEQVEQALRAACPEIDQRIAAGFIVEGHGDLRPEHVCLVPPPRIFDSLDFDRRMRILDPFDEVGYLGLECAFSGAPWIGPRLLALLERAIGHPPSARLQATYRAFRALLRARIALAHLFDDTPETPERWPDEARRYLAFCAEALAAIGMSPQ